MTAGAVWGRGRRRCGGSPGRTPWVPVLTVKSTCSGGATGTVVDQSCAPPPSSRGEDRRAQRGGLGGGRAAGGGQAEGGGQALGDSQRDRGRGGPARQQRLAVPVRDRDLPVVVVDGVGDGGRRGAGLPSRAWSRAGPAAADGAASVTHRRPTRKPMEHGDVSLSFLDAPRRSPVPRPPVPARRGRAAGEPPSGLDVERVRVAVRRLGYIFGRGQGREQPGPEQLQGRGTRRAGTDAARARRSSPSTKTPPARRQR